MVENKGLIKALKNLDDEIFIHQRNIKYNKFMLSILDDDFKVRRIDLELTIQRDEDKVCQVEEQKKVLNNKKEGA